MDLIKKYYDELAEKQQPEPLLEALRDLYNYKRDNMVCLRCGSPGLVNASSEPYFCCAECRYVTPLKGPLPSTRYVRCRCQALLIVRKIASSVFCPACLEIYRLRDTVYSVESILPLTCHCGQMYVTLYKHRYTHRCPRCFFSKYVMSSGTKWKGTVIQTACCRCTVPRWLQLAGLALFLMLATVLQIVLVWLFWHSCDSYFTPFPFVLLFLCACISAMARRSWRHYHRHCIQILQNVTNIGRCTVLPLPQHKSGLFGVERLKMQAKKMSVYAAVPYLTESPFLSATYRVDAPDPRLTARSLPPVHLSALESSTSSLVNESPSPAWTSRRLDRSSAPPLPTSAEEESEGEATQLLLPPPQRTSTESATQESEDSENSLIVTGAAVYYQGDSASSANI